MVRGGIVMPRSERPAQRDQAGVSRSRGGVLIWHDHVNGIADDGCDRDASLPRHAMEPLVLGLCQRDCVRIIVP